MPSADQIAALADHRTARADRYREEAAVLADLVVEANLRWALDQAIADGDDTASGALRPRILQVHDRLVDSEKNRTEATGRMAQTRLRALDKGAGFDLFSPPHPLLLLPVRLETRFAWLVDGRPSFTVAPGAARALLIRVVPDEIHEDSFEPALTSTELQWLTELHKGLSAAKDHIDLVRTWRQLYERVGPFRAGWFGELVRGPADITERPDRFARPTVARLLPDRWQAFAELDDGSTLTALSEPVREPLEIGVASAAAEWMVDFAEATRAGMGLTVTGIPSTVSEVRRLVVVGARGTLDPAESAAELAGVLEAHHYTRGLHLLRPGTATNSAPGARAGYTSRPDVNSVVAIDSQRIGVGGKAHPLVQPGMPSAGNDLAGALGIDVGVLGYVAGANASDQQDARDLRDLLTAASWRHITRFSTGILTPEALQTFGVVIGVLSAIGPLPTIGVGPQPYGVLPVLMRREGWPQPGTVVGDTLAVLDRMRPIWEQAVSADVSHVGKAGADPGLTLMRILQQDAVVRQVAFRPMLGPQLATITAQHLDPSAAANLAQARAAAAAAIDGLGAVGSAASPLVAAMFERSAAGLTAPLVEAPDLPDTSPMGMARYMELAASTRPDLLLLHDYGGAPQPRSLLFAIARLAMLHAADDAARAALIGAGANPGRWNDENVPSIFLDAYGTPLARLEAPDPLDPAHSIAVHLSELGRDKALLDPVRGLVRRIGSRSPEAIEVLLRATLGLFSHRLDAWYTGLATDRLTEMRNTPPTFEGLNIGGYGAVEHLRQSPRQPVPGESDLFRNPINGGFVHAPSVNQAVTAAILRSVHLAHSAAGAGEAFSVDLSSDRVRAALETLDGVRAGQPLSALIGYQVERALAAEGLQRFIAPLRRLAPLVANRLTPSTLPSEAVAATNVVDGLELLAQAGYAGGTPPTVAQLWQNTPTPGPFPNAKEEAALQRVLNAAYDALDAVADLAVAESVFQTVQGNPTRAGSTVDGLAGAPVPPPQIGVIETPRSGVGVTHRLLVLLEAADQLAPSGWAWTPRAKADPRIEAWARGVLPDPAQITVRARFLATDGAVSAALTLTLADLNAAPPGVADHLRIGARDLVQLSDAASSQSGLVLRLAALAHLRRPAAAKDTTLTLALERLDTSPASMFSLAEAAEIGRQIRAVLSHARALGAGDIATPAADGPAIPDAVDLSARGTAAISELGSVRAALVAARKAADPDALRTALFRADALAVSGAAPVTLRSTGNADEDALALANLQLQADAAVTELDQRAAAISQLPGDDLSGRLAAVFGSGFTVLPVLSPLPALNRVVGPTGTPNGATPDAVNAWLHRSARVREPVAALDRLVGYAETVGLVDADRPLPTAHVGQLAGAPGERWVALPPATGDAVPGGRISLVAFTAGPDLPEFGVTGVSGLLVDEWVDVVPASEQTTSVSFHLDAPSSAPPQVLLLGVPFPNHDNWTPQEAVQVVDEALALGRIRLVEAVPNLGQLLPMFISMENTEGGAAGLDVEVLTDPDA